MGHFTHTNGVDVVYSPYIESGKAYAVDAKIENKNVFSIPKTIIDNSEIDNHIRQMISRAFMLPASTFFNGYYNQQPQVKVIEWKRKIYESLTEWGNRLSADGLMDVPEIRMVYQNELAQSGAKSIRKLFSPIAASIGKKLKEIAHASSRQHP
jgi:hypothetical protein